MDNNLKESLDLNRLRIRLREKPRTKAGQVRQAWPDIRNLIAAGHSLRDIWMWLNEIGIEIGYARLSHYIGQLRRREEALVQTSQASKSESSERAAPGNAEMPSLAVTPEQGRTQSDPLANVMEREQKRPGFNYNSDPDLKKLI